jgi:WhiB family transcriptional regulator, redox-sensing transcriptional regulator
MRNGFPKPVPSSWRFTDRTRRPHIWADDALCASGQFDPDLWFPDEGASAEDARKLCRRCPVLTECRSYALRTRQKWGIWAALTPIQRSRLLKENPSLAYYRPWR